MRKFTLLLTSGIFLLLYSCVKDNFDFDRFSDKISYKPSFVIPLAHGSLTLGNLLESDDSLVFFDPDNSIRLMIREDTIFSVSVDDILDIPRPDPVWKDFVLNPVAVYPFETDADISLGNLVEPGRMSEPQASIIYGSDGSFAAFPEIWEQYMGVFSAGELIDFEFAEMTSGEVELELTNNFPVEISIGVNLLNENDWSQVGHFSFENVAPGQTVSASANLEGRIVRSNMNLEILRFSSPGSGDEEVYINLNDNLDIGVSSSGLMALRGNARIPVTSLEGGSDLLSLEFDKNIEVDFLSLESGLAEYGIENNVRGLLLNVEAVNMTNSEGPWNFEIEPDGRGGQLTGRADFSELDIDLEGYDNSIFVNYAMVVGKEEGMTEFDLTAETFSFNLALADFAVGYATGYFGQEEIDLDDEQFDIDFDLFDKITGDFRLTNPSIRLFYENSLGVPINIKFNLLGSSSDGAKSVSLFSADHPGFAIEHPEEPFFTASGEMVVNRETSEIVEFIALPPSEIGLEAGGSVNPAGKTGTPNFLTSQSRMTMGMEMELPLEMQLTNLCLTDTIEIDFDPDDIDMIEKLVMDLDVTNKFPVGVSLELSLYDSITGLALHRFDDVVLLEAAGVDEDGIVVPGEEAASSASLEIKGNTVGHLRQATHIIISGRMNTGIHGGQQVPVRFLTTSSLEFRIKLQADLNVTN